MTTTELAKKIVDSKGKIFTVTFTKRSNGEERVMNARTNVTKHLRGGCCPYDFGEKNLISVWDLKAEGYRSIPVEGITKLKINSKEYTV
jgi:hypothetical protein